MTITRRRFTAAAIGAGLASSSHFGSAKMTEIGGLPFGVHTFSFHEITQGGMPAVEEILAATRQLRLNSVELFAPQLSPFPMPEGFYQKWWAAAHPGEATAAGASAPLSTEAQQERRERLRSWRVNPPEGYFPQMRRRFAAAGVEIFALNYSFDTTMTDAELDAGFEQGKVLGARIITSSSTLSLAEKLVPFAERHRMILAFHNTTSSDPDRVVSPDAYSKLLVMSKWYRINLDVAHYSAAGYDPVRFIEDQHRSIVSLHVHDRKKNNGASVPNGEGDTPIRKILQLLHDRRWRIPSFYELEWVGSGLPIQEIAKDLGYIRNLGTP